MLTSIFFAVTPVKTGVQLTVIEILDSGLRRNDKKSCLVLNIRGAQAGG
jgi:hypothetical protein